MSRRLNAGVLLFAVSVVGCGKTEESNLNGTWVGQTVGFSKIPRFKEIWTFKDGTITVENPRYPDTVQGVHNYQVDATKEPKQIDMTLHRLGREELRLGIYKIENDTLTICELSPKRAKADATRPESFEDTGRDDVVLLTFQRKKDAPKKKEAPLEGQ